jgi:hypothetical protein
MGATLQGLDFFFQFEFLSLEVSQFGVIKGWSLELFLDRPIKVFVPRTKFANPSFNGHGLRLLAVDA